MSSIWNKIEANWPVLINRENLSFSIIKDKMEEFLIKKEIFPQAFGHFGIIVRNIEKSIEVIKKFDRRFSIKLIKEWVEGYKVYVGSIICNGIELELIEPIGESFFSTFLSSFVNSGLQKESSASHRWPTVLTEGSTEEISSFCQR